MALKHFFFNFSSFYSDDSGEIRYICNPFSSFRRGIGYYGLD